MPYIIFVSDAVEGTFVDLDGEGVGMPLPQIAAKIPEVVETIPQEHISDDLPVPQVVKENFEVIKVPQEREVVPQVPEETVELVKMVSLERVRQSSPEKIENVSQSPEETAEVPVDRNECNSGPPRCRSSVTADSRGAGRFGEVGLTGTSATADRRGAGRFGEVGVTGTSATADRRGANASF